MRKGIEITVPNSLNDITLEQYVKYIGSTTGEVELSEESHLELMLTIFCNIHLQHLNLLEAKQVADIMKRLLPVLNTIGSNDMMLISRFTFDGVEYGMIPNLDKISYGENKDIATFMSNRGTMHQAMAVLYRPITDTYKQTYLIEKYDASGKYDEVMKRMPLSVFLSAQVFFWSLIKELLKHTPKFLEKSLGKELYKELMQKESTNLTGEDMMKFTALLKEI